MDILKHLKDDTLQDLYVQEHQEERGSKLSKNKMVNSIADEIEASGVKSLLATMKRDDLGAMADSAKVEFNKKDNKKSKAVLTKKLGVAISKEGINDFLNNLSVDLLKSVAGDLEVKAGDKKEDLVHTIGDAVRKVGLESYFESLEVDSLQDVADDLGLKTYRTNNKRKLVHCIVNKEDVPKEPKAKKPKLEFAKKKKPIEKGTTYEDVFQHYYVGEVRDWCREHGLKTSGKKGVLIRRALAYLEGDESAKSHGKKGKGKAKANGTPSKAAKAKEEKEKEKEETKEEAAEEEEDEEKAKKKGK